MAGEIERERGREMCNGEGERCNGSWQERSRERERFELVEYLNVERESGGLEREREEGG